MGKSPFQLNPSCIPHLYILYEYLLNICNNISSNILNFTLNLLMNLYWRYLFIYYIILCKTK
nr:MAG TPA: hypothetical protein [Caudoviricetes sp.]